MLSRLRPSGSRDFTTLFRRHCKRCAALLAPSEAAVATATNDESNALRRQRDATHRAACEKLQGNEHWVKVVEERVEKQKGDSIMAFQQLQLTKEADCADFGREEYNMLQAAGFTRCLACLKILTCLSAGEKHRCRPPDQPVQPKNRAARAEPALQGNIQLDTALIAEVTTGFSHTSWMGVYTMFYYFGRVASYTVCSASIIVFAKSSLLWYRQSATGLPAHLARRQEM